MKERNHPATMRPVLLYDADCGVCSLLVRYAQTLDRQGHFEIRPYQDYPDAQKCAFGLSDAQFDKGIFLLNPAPKKVYHGVFAVNRFLFHFFPWNGLIVLLYALPVFLLLEMAAYTLIARNRTLISRSLGLKVCRLKRDK